MAILDYGTQTAGDVVSLYPQDDTNQWVHVVAPDGQELKVKRHGTAGAPVWLLQPGEWTYSWSGRDEGTLTVQEAPPAAPRQGRWR